MSVYQIAETGATSAAVYDPDVARVCLNCKRPRLTHECSANGCPAYRAAVKAHRERMQAERIRRAEERDRKVRALE